MLDGLEIKGFRTFEEYTVKDLGRVNLFVGRNNSGKTTILEAAEILLAPDTPNAVVGCAVRRGELQIERKQERRNRYVDVSHLFHGHRCDVGDSFSIKGRERGDYVSLRSEVQPLEPDHRRGKTSFAGDHKWSYEDRAHKIEIFYPRPFEYTPNLILVFPDKHFAPKGRRIDRPQKGAREPIYRLIDQRQDGFIIEICSLGQYGPSFKWKAQGIVS